MTTRPALFVLLALPTSASAAEWVTLINDGLTMSVQLETVANHCVEGATGLHNYVLAPTAKIQVRPTPEDSPECAWDVLTRESHWHVAVYATTAGASGGKYLLGFVQGNGTNDAAWMPVSDDDRFLVVTIRDAVGSLNVFVQQARFSRQDRTEVAALSPR